MIHFNKLVMFAKAQLSAFTGGLIDYLIMLICTEIFHIHYTLSIAIGGIVGAIVNFTINRKWTFKKHESDKKRVRPQLLKFISMVVGSICLKSSGTYVLTTLLRIDYKISRILVDILVSFGFNYTLQKYWVFRKENQQIN